MRVYRCQGPPQFARLRSRLPCGTREAFTGLPDPSRVVLPAQHFTRSPGAAPSRPYADHSKH